MNQRKALCVVFCGICVVMTPAVHASADDLATYLEATLGSVRTLSLDFNQTSSEMRLENMTGKFIAVLDVGRVIRMRSTLITPLGPEELIIKDGKHIGLRGKTRTYTVNTELETAAAWGTPLFYASWVTRIKDKPYFGAILSSLHEQPYTTVDPPSAAHRPDALFYSTKYDDTVQLLGFSPAHNYLPCYRRLTPIGTEDWAEDPGPTHHFLGVFEGFDLI